MKNKYIGITQTNSGNYISATLIKSDSGDIISAKFDTYEAIGIKEELLWGNSGIICGVPVTYRPKDSLLFYENSTKAINEDVNSIITPYCDSSDLLINLENFESNIIKITTVNAFLTTIPMYLCKKDTDSFISIFFTDTGALISVTIDKLQKVVFRFIGKPEKELVGYIGRIQRYWAINFSDINFPINNIFILNKINDVSGELLKLKADLINISWLNDVNKDQFIAVGLALSYFNNYTPLFAKPTQRAAYRKQRYLINIFSVSILFIMFLITSLIWSINKINNIKIDKLETEYKKIISSDIEVKSMIDRNLELAKTILNMENNISKKTRWAQFLYTLGVNKLDDLFIERLGSESIKGDDSRVKIAILGYASNERSITNLISLLQKTTYITKVSLVSMEKDKKRTDKYRFKVLCILLSNE